MDSRGFRIPALGRPAFLGQLYNANTGRLLNDALFASAVAAAATPEPDNAGHSDTKYYALEDSETRAKSLSVDASVSVSLMGGSLKLKGEGSYLDNTQSSEVSTTISGVVNNSTEWLRLRADMLLNAALTSEEKLRKTGATHVVMGVLLGGSLVGTVTESNSKSNDVTNVHGGFSIDLAQSFGFLAGASGEAKLDMKNKIILSNYSLELRLLGDYLDPDPKVAAPVTLESFNKKLIKGLSLLKVGVPVSLHVAPLGQFNGISIEAMYKELEAAQMSDIMMVYDRMMALNQRRLFLVDEVSEQGELYFPSFLQSCQEASDDMNQYVTDARVELGELVQSCRKLTISNPSEAVADYISRREEELDQKDRDYKNAFQDWGMMLRWKKAASDGKFPLTTVQDLSTAMDSTSRNSIALVILPDNAIHTEILNQYQNLHTSVLTLNTELKLTTTVVCGTLYADSQIDDALLLLDGGRGEVKLALDHARATATPSFLTYRLSRKSLGLEDWKTSSSEGWGTFIDTIGNRRYVGEMREGKAHGVGIMTFSNEDYHSGTWFKDKRDGEGERFDANQHSLEKGVYVDDVLRRMGRLVTVTVFDDSVPIDTETVAVVVSDRPPTPDPQFEKLVAQHVQKFAEVLGWKHGQRHRLTTLWSGQQWWLPHEDNYWDMPGAQAVPSPFWSTWWSDLYVITNGPAVEKINYSAFGATAGPWLDGPAEWWDGKTDHITEQDLREYGEPVRVEAVVLHD